MNPWNDNDLNGEQVDAIQNQGNVFLIACPGSGKTRTLTYKIAYELEKIRGSKKFVVAITYTHRAADEISERIEGLGIDTAQLWIGTIHSFCLEWILKPYAIYEPDLAAGFHVIDSFEREKILEEICKDFRTPRVTHWDCEFYFDSKGYHLSCKEALCDSVHAVLSKYFDVLAEGRKIDFELILYHAHQIIQQKPNIAQILSNLFEIILVDEYQDTKEIQYNIIAAILSAGSGLTRGFIVGDPNQSIFKSLGGYPIDHADLELLTKQKFIKKELSINYRSAPRIIQYFGNFNFHATKIRHCSDRSEQASLVTFNSAISLGNLRHEIVRLIRHSLDQGIRAEEICVLAPWWFTLSSMTRHLVVDLPECEFNGPGMVPFSRDIDNFWYKAAKIALTEASPQMYVRRLRWARELLGDLETAGVHVAKITPKLLLKYCNTIHLHHVDGLEYLEDFFGQLLVWLKADLTAYDSLRSHYETFFKSSRERIARLANDGATFISELAAFRRVFQNRSGVTVSSIHGIKGAEFDCVIAYGLLEGMVPHFSDANGRESAMKMLYVVSSRARKHLHLISERERPRQDLPTKVLMECDFDYDLL